MASTKASKMVSERGIRERSPGHYELSAYWPFRFHDLRHLSATEMVGAGMDLRTVGQSARPR